MNLPEALAKLESLGDEKRRAHNAKTGPDGVPGPPPDRQFGCATGDIRALAKKIKTNHALGLDLWRTGNLDAQLLAILLMKPKELSAADLDRMVREARFTWVADWFSAYLLKEQPDDVKEALRLKWMKQPVKDPRKDPRNDPRNEGWAARAGWNLTASKINKAGGGKGVKDAEELDLPTLLDRIEKEMPKAPPETKWAMNNTLGAIGIHHAKLRKRVIAIGETIGPYKDWPVSKGCTIPYVPVWVAEMVKRQG